MRVDEFDFTLPEDRIALKPSDERDGARLLHVPCESDTADRMISDLPEILKPGDLLVLNDTRVIPAQLNGVRAARKEGGGGSVSIDATLHKRINDTDEGVVWEAFVRPAKRLREGDIIDFAKPGSSSFSARVIQREGPAARLQFHNGGAAFDTALSVNGAPPLPPYIARKRALSRDDIERYQTVYAENPGSVAAPTAGLHFTDALLARLSEKGVGSVRVTLHVGAGTFLPVSVDDTRDHKMHSEWGEITQSIAAEINSARMKGGRVIAVGTTALRLLESAASPDGGVEAFCSDTDIFITPGYQFKIADVLLTNFHLPRSTLFMLVCAFAGTQRMRQAYEHAIKRKYQFYSYGDACLLERSAA